ncbi:MAG: ABC transporter permease subunit [candidate division Zixibacteria bacterium]|nr:ABC transporter permease subunit [candidate division Zixibacteria bacterium]
MLSVLIVKELKGMISSPRFVATFAICSILMLLSVYIGINEYHESVKQYQTTQQLIDQQLREESNWSHLNGVAQREPNPLQIFAGGINYDLGRMSAISGDESVNLKKPHYSDNPVYAVFRIIDFTFIAKFILTLFAILFTYNAVNGERERGTLQLLFSNSIPRAKYLIAKCAGSWLGLVVPLSIPVLLCLLMIMAFKVPLSLSHWGQIIMIILSSLLLFTFFIVLGVLISTLTRRSNISFLISLVVWVVLVLIIPRAGVLAAGQLVEVPRVAEIEGQRDAFAKDKWGQYHIDMEERWKERGGGTSCGGGDPHEDEEVWGWIQEEDAARKQVEKEIESFDMKLREDLRRRKAARIRLAGTLARFSPASAYQLTTMALAETDIFLKSRYEDSMNSYRTQFVDYVDQQAANSGPGGGHIMISMSSEDGFSMTSGADAGALDISGLPQYIVPVSNFAEIVAQTVIDFGLLCLYIMMAFAGAFISFLRYDIR